MSAWRDDARCRVADPELFEHERETKDARALAAAVAGAWCSRCPVAIACLAAAMAEEEDLPQRLPRLGIRGGLTGRQRARLARVAGPVSDAAALASAVPPRPRRMARVS